MLKHNTAYLKLLWGNISWLGKRTEIDTDSLIQALFKMQDISERGQGDFSCLEKKLIKHVQGPIRLFRPPGAPKQQKAKITGALRKPNK